MVETQYINDDVDVSDVIRILVATDNHLGYAEKNPVRGDDSFIAFEEILSLAVREEVDMILLGGDLFHDAVPSQNSLDKCMALLRRYTFGKKDIAIEIPKDQMASFHNSVNDVVNYEDPNLRISIPVFSIHGNHDDPSGFGRLSSLDLLATCGLVNYFGRWTDLTKVDVQPIQIRKGATKLALYGLSHIQDARLARLFENFKVQFDKPEGDDWFHFLALHQNRADRGIKNFIEEEKLPSFLNLILWGHEHDCRIEPEHNSKCDFYVCQPGSSVPTSLAEGESLKKHVGLLEIYNNQFKLKPLPLQTVRPFVFESINLETMVGELRLDEGDASNKVKQMAEDKVMSMIERAKEKITGHSKQPILPLIRLRLIFQEEEQMFNAIRFGQMFNTQVANPTDIIHFKKQIKREKTEGLMLDGEALSRAYEKMNVDSKKKVEDFVDGYFEETKDSKPLQLFSSKIMTEICYRLVKKSDATAFDSILKDYKQNAVKHLMDTLPNDDFIQQELTNFKNSVNHEEISKSINGDNNRVYESVVGRMNATVKNELTISSETAQRGRKRVKDEIDYEDDDNSDDEVLAHMAKVSTSTRGRSTRARGRGNSNTTTRAATTSNTTIRNTRALPQLDVSVSNDKKRSTRQATLLDAISMNTTKTATKTSTKKIRTYVISDDSD